MSVGSSRTTSVCLRSCPDYLPHLRRIATCVADSAGLDREESDDVMLAVNEACANAIRHGSPRGVDDRVVLTLKSSGCVVTVEVTDFGGPKAGPQPLECPGLGIRLMRMLTDEVRFVPHPQGLTVRLVKRAANRGARRGCRAGRAALGG